jgi:predicted RecA/RadA family phage recombinase
MSNNLTIFDFKLVQMPTYLKTGIYQPPFTKTEEEAEQALVYIDENVIQVLNAEDDLVIQFTYEELRGIMAVMAAEQEKSHLYIQARTKLN